MESDLSQATALHRSAAAAVTAAGATLDPTRPADSQKLIHELAEELRGAAAVLAPGWLGAPLDAQSLAMPLGGPPSPRFVRIGVAQPLDDARFPVLVPLLGAGHLSIAGDVRDPRVAGLVRAVLLRLLAAVPSGSLLVRAVDATGGERGSPAGTFTMFAPLADTGMMAPPATDRIGLRGVLADAEQWLRPARPAALRHHRRDRIMLLIVAALPEFTDTTDLDRIERLAELGPDSGLHLIVAGWPPPPLTPDLARATLPFSTRIDLRDPHVVVGDPPGDSYREPAARTTGQPGTGLNAPVFLDAGPPAHLVDWVCRELTSAAGIAARPNLRDLLPEDADGLWTESAADGLMTAVGYDSATKVTLQLNDLTPHWLIGGRSGAGTGAFLTAVLYGLCARYAPNHLALYLLDLAEGVSFGEVLPSARHDSWLPQIRAAGIEADPEYGLAVLHDLAAELDRRSWAAERAGATRFADLTASRPMPRIVCVISEYPALVTSAGPARTLLEKLARAGRSCGIHLLLSSRGPTDAGTLPAGRDPLSGQFPVRVALPGGGTVLQPGNDAAAGLPPGTAVVNTAGGLGGPRGATRGHERVVRFPDPYADRAGLAAVRHRIWSMRPAGAAPPPVFTGYSRPSLTEDPAYRDALAGHCDRPAALLGRVVDVPLRTAAFRFESGPGRHLAILDAEGPGPELLATAARSVAAHHPPGGVRMLIADLTNGDSERVHALAAELAQRQQVTVVDGAGLVDAAAGTDPGYLVVFGLDAIAAEGETPARLRILLREGPSHGRHLISWWRSIDAFRALNGEGGPDIAGLVFLAFPAADVSTLLDQELDWRPRPGRALLYDAHTGRGTVFIPFVAAERVE